MASISTALRNQLANSMRGGAGINYNSGVLQLRSGAAPGPNAAASGTLLAAWPLASPAFDAASTGQIDIPDPIVDSSADGTGTAGHWRMIQSGDTGGATGSTDERIEGSVGTSGAELNLDSLSITAGQEVTLQDWAVNVPIS